MRRDLAALGVALVFAGIAVSLSPAVDGGLPATTVALVGVGVALFAAISVSLSPHTSAGEDGPDDESEQLGSSFDDALSKVESLSSAELRREDAPREVRERLRVAAVATVARCEGVDRETASERVARGAWTTDPVAAAFLSESTRAPLPIRFRERLSTTPRVVLRTRRTAAVLEGKL